MEIKINVIIENTKINLKDMVKTISEIEEEYNCNCTLTTNVINTEPNTDLIDARINELFNQYSKAINETMKQLKI